VARPKKSGLSPGGDAAGGVEEDLLEGAGRSPLHICLKEYEYP